MKKEKIRPLYSEFQGYLSQAPVLGTTDYALDDQSIWTKYNQAVDSLIRILDEDYDRFRLQPLADGCGLPFINLSVYRQKLGGLISYLHGEYFSDERPPFSGTPSTMITQSQQQSQAVQIQMLLEIQSRIDELIPNHQEGSKERTFLQKAKSSLTSVKNVPQLLILFFRIAKECGLSIDGVLKVFG
ncbi:MAG: hypothetical protein E3J82_03555 [Candidatus Thorarchaeota archaeon]|nr:MAG: hypothetical protein E3J82_03555 [Candidatus Thorarchaeota archaeon]